MRFVRFVAILMAVLGLSVFANVFGEDGHATENWCYPGELWGDGRCDHEQPSIRDYKMNLGWYLYRWQHGYLAYADIPLQYRPAPPILQASMAGSQLVEVSTPDEACHLVLVVPDALAPNPDALLQIDGRPAYDLGELCAGGPG